MGISIVIRGIALGLAAMLLSVAVAILWVWVYSIAVAPGHDGGFYQAYAAQVSPIAGIIAGVPILFGAGWLAARATPDLALAAAAVPALAYAMIDGGIVLLAAPAALAAWPVFLISWSTKLLAALAAGALVARRG